MRWLLFMVAAMCFIIPNAFGQPFQIEHGKNFDRQLLGVNEDGTLLMQWTSQPERIVAGTNQFGNPVYSDYKLTETADQAIVETEHGSLILHKIFGSFEFYPKGYISGSPLLGDSIVAKKATVGTTNWNNVGQINDAACIPIVTATETKIILDAHKQVTGVGELDYQYVYENGKWKTSLLATNWSGLTNQKFGFTQTIDLNRDTIKWGNGTINMQNHNGTTYNRAWIDSHESKIVDLMNGMYFDFDLSLPYLYQVTIYAYADGTSKIVFDYLNTDAALLPNETVVYDPTYNQVADNRGRVYSNGGGTGNCDTRTAVSEDSLTDVFKRNTNTACEVQWVEWTDLATIPTNGVVKSAYFEWDQTGTTSWIENCVLYAYANQPSTLTGIQKWDQGWAGTKVNSTGTAKCLTDGTNKRLNFDSTGIANLQANISGGEGWFGGMFQAITPAVDAAGRTFLMTTGESRLNIVYSLPLNPPTNLSCDSVGRQVQCIWTAPINATDVNGYYFGRSLDNSTFTNKTAVANGTSLTDTHYWKINQLYYTNLTATDGLTNSSLSAYTSFTTDDVPDAPSLSLAGISENVINATSTAGTSDGGDTVDDFGLRCEKNDTGGWVTVVSNSTLPWNREYSITSLSLVSGDILVCQWRDGNDVGWSDWSANATGSTFKVPDGTVTFASGNVGDVLQANTTVTITKGFPTPTVTKLEILQNNTVVKTITESQSVPIETSVALDPAWYQILDDLVHEYSVRITATNGTVANTWVSTSNSTLARQYDPSYFTAVDRTQGTVNFTVSRSSDQDTVHLQINRDKGGATFNVECLYQTQAQALVTTSTAGTWINESGVGYYNRTISGFTNSPLYGTCYNDGELFTFQSYTNGTLTLFGIAIFDASYGAMLGVPVGVFFLVLTAGMANKRTAPTWIIVLLGMAGILATIGFFSLSPIVWGFALVTALLGVLVNQKVF